MIGRLKMDEAANEVNRILLGRAFIIVARDFNNTEMNYVSNIQPSDSLVLLEETVKAMKLGKIVQPPTEN